MGVLLALMEKHYSYSEHEESIRLVLDENLPLLLAKCFNSPLEVISVLDPVNIHGFKN
jgi:hypothetical protein